MHTTVTDLDKLFFRWNKQQIIFTSDDNDDSNQPPIIQHSS